MKRYTFVVQVQPEGPSTVENLSTHERVRVEAMADVGAQIERWVEALARDGQVQAHARAPERGK